MPEFWIDTAAAKKREVHWMTKNKKDIGSSGFTSGVPRNFFFRGWGCVQQIKLRTEDRENGDLGAVAP